MSRLCSLQVQLLRSSALKKFRFNHASICHQTQSWQILQKESQAQFKRLALLIIVSDHEPLGRYEWLNQPHSAPLRSMSSTPQKSTSSRRHLWPTHSSLSNTSYQQSRHDFRQLSDTFNMPTDIEMEKTRKNGKCSRRRKNNETGDSHIAIPHLRGLTGGFKSLFKN